MTNDDKTIRSSRPSYDQQPTNNISRPVRSLEPRPASPASTSQQMAQWYSSTPPEDLRPTEAEKKLLLRLRQLQDTIVTVVVLNGEPLMLATPPKTEHVGSKLT